MKKKPKTISSFRITPVNTGLESLSPHEIDALFAESQGNIHYARETQLFDQKTETLLKITVKKIVFNRAFDESIFDLTVPTGFKLYRSSPLLDTQ